MKLAMRMGGHYRLDHIQPHHVEAQAISCGIPGKLAASETSALAASIGQALTPLADRLQAEGCPKDLLQRIVDAIGEHARRWMPAV